MGSSMASELGVLSHALKAIAVSDRRTRDFTITALSKTIVEVVACASPPPHLRQRHRFFTNRSRT